MVRKINLILVVSLIFMLIISGCSSGKDTGGQKNRNIAQTFSDRVKAEIEVPTIAKTDSEDFDERFKGLYGISIDDIEDYTIMENNIGIRAWTIAMFKMKDPSKTQEGLDAAKLRGDLMANSFKNYLAEQYAIAKNYIAIENNGYILLAIGPEAEEVKDIFMDLTK